MNKLDILKNVREAFFKYKRNNPILTPSVSSFVAGWRAREEFEKEEENQQDQKEVIKIEVSVTEVTLVTGSGTDKIYIKFRGPSPYPDWMPEEKPFLKLEVSKGYGLEYCEKFFGIEPRIIKT